MKTVSTELTAQLLQECGANGMIVLAFDLDAGEVKGCHLGRNELEHAIMKRLAQEIGELFAAGTIGALPTKV